jgi:hypothetical protein
MYESLGTIRGCVPQSMKKREVLDLRSRECFAFPKSPIEIVAGSF